LTEKTKQKAKEAGAAAKDFFNIWFDGTPLDVFNEAQERAKVHAAKLRGSIGDAADAAGDAFGDAAGAAAGAAKGAAAGAAGAAGAVRPDGLMDRVVQVLDTDGDDKVEFQDMIEAEVSGKGEEELILKSKVFPVFILATSALAALLWFISATMNQGTGATKEEKEKSWTVKLGGMEGFWPGYTDLCVNQDCIDYRAEIWRWWTYQFTHIGLTHLGMNCLMNVILGIPLEKLHGTLKMAVMYNIGVFGGACCYFVTDARHFIVGMSGGCYALIGIHLAYTIINWHQKKYRKLIVAFLIFLFVVDLVNYYGATKNDNETKVSHSAHAGGYIAGLLIGIVLGENLHVKEWETHLKRIALILGLVFCVFSLGWGMFWPPMTITDPYRWCWSRQVYNKTIFGDRKWHCVRCGNDDCIARWNQQRWISTVPMETCQVEYGGWEMDE